MELALVGKFIKFLIGIIGVYIFNDIDFAEYVNTKTGLGLSLALAEQYIFDSIFTVEHRIVHEKIHDFRVESVKKILVQWHVRVGPF